MMKRLLINIVAIALLGTFVGNVAGESAAPRPNVVFLLADDLGSYDVGWRGSDIQTPNLDKLALSGMRLEQFYVQPVCSPTRAALMTGRYPFRHGLQVGVVRPWAQYGLPLEERTLPQALAEAGYETAIAGKWHLGHFRPEYLPTRRGFQHQYGHYNGALDYFTHIRDGGFDWHRDDRENHDPGYSTHLIAREAVRRIQERDKTKPLFLYVPFNAVHAPHQVPDRYTEPYSARAGNRRTYAGMVAALDEAVGQIAAAVAEQELTDNTLFIFASDNGGPNPGRLTNNGPLRAGKGTVYEGGVRVCAFATWPGKIATGGVLNAPAHMVDWYPTLLRLAGAATEQKLPVDGRDLWPLLAGEKETADEREIVINAAPRGGAIRTGNWKLVLNGGAKSGDGDETDDVASDKSSPVNVELFDLSSDPGEAQNLAATRPEVVKRLQARYDHYAAQAVAPKSSPKPRGFQSPKVWGQAD